MKSLITFRLRKEMDADLISLNVDDQELSGLCRDGLRLMLGIRTTKHVEVKEKQIIVPEQTKERSIQGKPAVYLFYFFILTNSHAFRFLK